MTTEEFEEKLKALVKEYAGSSDNSRRMTFEVFGYCSRQRQR